MFLKAADPGMGTGGREIVGIFLLEVTLQQALQCRAVAGLISKQALFSRLLRLKNGYTQYFTQYNQMCFLTAFGH
jgi:hypothetical protein